MGQKKGKFIKRDSSVLHVASVKDFSFENISTYPSLIFDNKSKSLIQPDLHTKQSIDEIVNFENRCDLDLVNSEGKRGLLWPVDFTQEIRSEDEYTKLLKNYQLNQNELEQEVGFDDFSEGMEDLSKGEDLESDLESDEKDQSLLQSDLKNQEFLKDKQSAVSESKTDSDTAMDKNLDTDSNESKNNFSNLDDLDTKIDTDTTTTTAIDDNTQNGESELNLANQTSSSFDNKREDSVSDGEGYLNQDLSGIEDRLKEEFDRGYKKAKSEFEEKTSNEEKNVDEKIDLITNNVKSIVEGLSGLKKSILSSASKNYLEIAQAVSESLIRKELVTDADKLKTLIEQAVEKIPDNNISVRVSKKMYDRLSDIASAEKLKNILVSDSQIEDGDFRVESDFNVIDGSLYNMVKDMLKDFNLNLFEESKSSDENKTKVQGDDHTEDLTQDNSYNKAS